jgi:high frequency lysogenization protein
MTTSTDQALALAAVLQSAYLVDEIAREGRAPAENINPLIHSVFEFDANSSEAIYNGVENLEPGLKLLQQLLNGQQNARYQVAIRYALGIFQLQHRASKQPGLFDVLHSRLLHSAVKAEHFSNNINEVAHSVAGVYQDTISTLKYRLHIKGSAEQLQKPENADMIRALLMAGIRAAVLWRQVGGRRWHLFFARKRLSKAVEDLLAR